MLNLISGHRKNQRMARTSLPASRGQRRAHGGTEKEAFR